MFPSPFPNDISFVCGDISLTKDINLHFEERKILESFGSQERKSEFILGRKIAHLALKKFRLESQPILRNPKTREPRWPESVYGSITHSRGLAAVAIGLNTNILGIGIDLEDLSRKISFKISRHICVDEELYWLEKQVPERANLNLRIIFSAKESIFKCFFPRSRKYIPFKDAFVEINEEKSEFSYKLSKEYSNVINYKSDFNGIYSIKNKFLMTSTYLKNKHT